jgi:S-adenosylmethionine decarboxylase
MAQKKEITYGWELILNLYDCDLEAISSKKKIAQFSKELCEIIKMVPYGKPLIPYFGHNKPHTKGYSLVQLIETSSITAHFSEHKRSVYLNIFSCMPYDEKKAKAFSKEFFGAKRVKAHYIIRQ